MTQLDNFWAIVSFFILALVLVGAMLMWKSVVTDSPELFDSSIGPSIQGYGNDAIGTFDFIGVMFYFGIHLGILVLSYLLRTHPVVFIASIILIAILVLFAAPMSNAWEDITSDATIATATDDLPKVNHIMSNLPKYELIWAIVSAIVLFGFARSEGLV